jgi:ABC-type uncharacterized transport system substrate-binding protein
MGASRIVLHCAYILALLSLASAANAANALPKCFFVSSYHKGYAWSDGVEAGLRSTLRGKCELRQFDMDTKRRKGEADKKQAALQAKALIEDWKPDVVITADDNAARYLIKPHYRDRDLPFVFCGVNWTVSDYQFPYRNVTGIVEVAPIRPMLKRALKITGNAQRAFYIGAKTLTESKNLKRFEKASRSLGFLLDHALVSTMAEWVDAYRKAQDYDFVIVGSKGGINDWDDGRVEKAVLATTKRLSVTNHDWMMPFTILGITKIPEEHGEWAAKSALRIIDGMPPSDIPIVSNSRRDLWINASVLAASPLKLSKTLLKRAKIIEAGQTNS